jgi:hypothetical protein
LSRALKNITWFWRYRNGLCYVMLYRWNGICKNPIGASHIINMFHMMVCCDTDTSMFKGVKW